MYKVVGSINGEEIDMSGYSIGTCLKCGAMFIYVSIMTDEPDLCDSCEDAHIEKTVSYKKQPISDAHRWEVWERDNFTCQVCGSRKNLSVDHIIPESRGGVSHPDNYQTLCKKCNSRKGAR